MVLFKRWKRPLEELLRDSGSARVDRRLQGVQCPLAEIFDVDAHVELEVRLGIDAVELPRGARERQRIRAAVSRTLDGQAEVLERVLPPIAHLVRDADGVRQDRAVRRLIGHLTGREPGPPPGPGGRQPWRVPRSRTATGRTTTGWSERSLPRRAGGPLPPEQLWRSPGPDCGRPSPLGTPGARERTAVVPAIPSKRTISTPAAARTGPRFRRTNLRSL